MQLNRNEPYSPVYGSSRAAFFQVVGKRGFYFAADGTEVPPEVAAEPAPDDDAPPPAPPQPIPEDLPIVARDDRRAQLGKLHAIAVGRLVLAAGGTPATGQGSRAKNVAWLLENTAP